MTRSELVRWGLVALAGAGLGARAVVGFGQAEAALAPDGWTRTELEVPFRRPDLTGALGVVHDAYFLDHFESLIAPGESQTLELELELSEGSTVRVELGERHGHGVALYPSEGRAEQLDGLGRETCTGSLEPVVGRNVLRIERNPEGFVARLGSGELQCKAGLAQGPDRVAVGLRRVHVHRFEGEGFALPPPASAPAVAGGAAAGLLLALAIGAAELATGASLRALTLSSAPWLLAWFLLGRDGYLFAEDMRLAGLPPQHIPLLFALVPGLALKILHACARVARHPRFHLAAVALGAAAFAAIGAALTPAYAFATVYLAGVGACLAAVVWANVRTVRFFNVLSLAGVIGALAFAEHAVRFTETGVGWSRSGGMQNDPVLGWTRRAVAEFEALEQKEYSHYPRDSYPVAPAEATGVTRIVAFGGSSTGGAFQNDNLGDFYPKRLELLVAGRAQVLNQGVGGWSTFHIAEYAEQAMPELDPDVVTVYVGHNDGFTRTSRTYKEMYARWQDGASLDPPSSDLNLRLLNGFGFFLRALQPRELTVAVPVDHARENLERVIVTARTHGAKVLLASEGINPDPGGLQEYWDVMRELAEGQDDVAWLDTATMLRAAGDRMFMDDCHLTQAGHSFVAEAFAAKLEGLGWLP